MVEGSTILRKPPRNHQPTPRTSGKAYGSIQRLVRSSADTIVERNGNSTSNVNCQGSEEVKRWKEGGKVGRWEGGEMERWKGGKVEEVSQSGCGCVVDGILVLMYCIE